MKMRRIAMYAVAAAIIALGILNCAGAANDRSELPKSPITSADAAAPDGQSTAATTATLLVTDTKLAVAREVFDAARLDYLAASLASNAAPDDAGVVKHLDAAVANLDAAAASVAALAEAHDEAVRVNLLNQAADAASPDPKKQQEIEFENGGRLRYGLSLSLLQLSATRSSSEPGRLRNYAPRLETVPPELGFQFTYQPHSYPWRLRRKDGTSFQLMSWGGMLLAGIRNSNLEQGAIRLGATLNFFENVIGLGAGFDLYRGIPVLGADGTAGGATAYTGLLSWAIAKQGEVTPENFFFVVTLGVDPIVKALTGELR
jgi:hypothetical protein